MNAQRISKDSMQYFIGKNGQQLGPFSIEEVRGKLVSGEFSISDLAWCGGMAGWEPLGQIFNNPYQPSMALGQSPLFSPEIQHLRLAGRGSRLGAVMLNGLFLLLAAIPLMLGAAFFSEPDSSSPQHESFSTAGELLIGAGALTVLGLLVYQVVMMSKTGQSLGKRIMGIRVVAYDTGNNPGFVRIFLLREFVSRVIGLLPFVGMFYSIVDACLIFREDTRCIHDFLATTRVVRV